ncbi:MAG: FlgD immunoglobulin-like domain containing protein [Campylobacterota bacterium]|nr:FlgD immunoglobulin-like domain containing protein [Campylobacterota bacterium]
MSAIGKTADLGSNAISFDKGTASSFEVYFPNDIASGTLEVIDGDGKIVSTMDIEENPQGVYQFDWDGSLNSGGIADSGVYFITASYSDSQGNPQTTRMGAYPIESVRFEDGDTLVKVGSAYVPLKNIVEVY